MPVAPAEGIGYSVVSHLSSVDSAEWFAPIRRYPKCVPALACHPPAAHNVRMARKQPPEKSDMPPAAPAPARPADRHKKRHMIGLRESIYKLVEKAAGTNNRPTTWEIEVAIAYYLVFLR